MAREDGPSYPHPNGMCRFLDFQRFHGVPCPWDSVSSIFVVICGYSYDLVNFKSLPQRDSMAIPILLPLGVSIFGSDASFLFQKVN